MMRARYIRFINAVQTPGRAGAQISKAYTTAAEASTAPIDERMTDILVGPEWVLLRAKRKDSKGSEYIAERVTHASNIRDFEPDGAADAKQKTRAEKEPTA